MLDGVQCSKPGMLKVARVSDLLHRLFEEEQGVEEIIQGFLAKLPPYHTQQSISIKKLKKYQTNSMK